MSYFVLFLINLVFIFIGVVCKYGEEQIDFGECFMISNVLFCIRYLIISIPLLYFDYFSVKKTLVILIFLSAAYTVISFIRKKGSRRVTFNKEFLFILLLFLCVYPLIRITAQDISDVSDQGAYFKHYSLLYYGESYNSFELNEKGIISQNVDQGVDDLQKDLVCFYSKDSTIYSIHAIKTWCVIWALFGKIFGFYNGLLSINYLYYLSALIIFYILKRVSDNRITYFGLFILYSLSPVVLYIAKAGLTESLYGLLLLAGLYALIRSKNEKKWACFAGISFGISSFVHISYVVLIFPLFLLLYILSFFDRRYNIVNGMQMLLYACSLWYIKKLSPIYCEDQYNKLTGGHNIELFCFISAFSIIFVFVHPFLQNKVVEAEKWIYIKSVFEQQKKWFSREIKAALILIVVLIKYRASILINTRDYEIVGDGASWNLRNSYVGTNNAFYHLNIVNIARATGIVILVVVVLFPIISNHMTRELGCYYGVFLYFLFYNCVITIDTPFNYYASRYFYPILLPMVFIIFSVLPLSKNVIIACLICAVIFWWQFLPAFAQGGPKVGEYEILEDTLAKIPANSIVLMDEDSSDLNTMLTSNLRIINHNLVYNYKDKEEILNYYENQSVYVISSDEKDGKKILVNGVYSVQGSFGNGANGSYATSVGESFVSMNIYELR
ncbi:hypothetical protein SAMN04487829_1929 [Pseudobutyrivibrio sp. NOR37]|uniref:Glycosyltransferase RgtA/B/C/D-like domain-containing protein n=1 Tax=Pseudobutyrivibrio xylanivorans TaxID=185007 RepID=A0A6M0LIS8_PSEXY|nr:MULTISPECIES: hypothetical protein [Pseudobutyrivibrio]NEX02306.1 hypothetical protein [Pseudobutyrivibrio xylanivorans]SFR77957.1 hypothetical protein SAMN04487829_1929 [Pseudobutyrivibrio sp. NOR37]